MDRAIKGHHRTEGSHDDTRIRINLKTTEI